ncbi:cupredoxin family copper-binding protein [Nitrobacter sp. NHB1]|uniref:cupredoxin domain-containing protein n=1 Tax=Nitrobacter sp. NHB1 TaxID=3119830 RepID=UPI002FFF04FB
MKRGGHVLIVAVLRTAVLGIAVLGIAALGISVPARAATVQISIHDLVYAPAETTAKVGDTVEWVNNDVFVHSATARNGDWDVELPPQKTVTLVLKKPGVVDYYCRYHPNMKGRLTIAP